jgi:hypothetical protein
MIIEWIVGALFRPSATFARARHELHFDYWWILLSVLTLNILVALYRPLPPGQESVPTLFLILYVSTVLLVLLDLQALLLLGVGRLFRWQLTWAETLRYVGLAWSIHLLENMITFPLALQGESVALLWIGIPFLVWYVVILTAGVRQLSGLSLSQSLLITVMATLPWQVGLYWLTFASLTL